MNKITLKAEKRETLGRKVKSLRRDGILPGNIYGKKQKSLAIQVELKEFQKVFEDAGETGLLDLKVGNKSVPVLIDNVQEDPVTNRFLHVDFRQVNLKEKITAEVPIEIVGESPAEKQGLGTLVQHIDEVEVEALPTDFPDKFDLDVSKLEDVDMALFVKDLVYDKKKVKIESDLEEIVVKVEPLREEEPEELPPVEEETVDEETGEAAEGAEEGKEPTTEGAESEDVTEEKKE
jgi:large subunit ribosomal protein L25